MAGALGGAPQSEARRRPRVNKADPEKARAQALVKDGVRKLRDGDYVTALDLFSKAYALFPSPKIQFNLGQTYTELGRYLDALKAYEAFRAQTPAGTSKEVLRLVEERIADLMRRVVVITLECAEPEAIVVVDGQPRGQTPLGEPIRLMPGPHSVVLRKDGFLPAVLNLKLQAGQQETLKVSLERPKPKVVQVVWQTRRKPRKGLPVLWSGVAVTAAAAITAAVTGGLAMKEESIAKDVERPWTTRVAAADRGRALQRATDGLLIGAGVVALGTLVWYLVVVRRSGGTEKVRISPPPPRAGIELAPGGFALTW
jgi:hypothetical protein